MKQKILALSLLLLTACTVFYFVSCKKEKIYSCNEALNEYAAITMQAHQGISRDSLAKFGLDTQFAIINSLSPENNARILREKIVALLTDELVNDNDKAHLQNLYNYVNPGMYEEGRNEQNAFLDQWKDYAYNTLNWDQRKMEIYLYTWLTEAEMNAIRTGGMYLQPAPRESGGGEYNCNCDGGYLCETILRKTCVNDGCKKTSWGCGFGWAWPCNGRCSI